MTYKLKPLIGKGRLTTTYGIKNGAVYAEKSWGKKVFHRSEPLEDIRSVDYSGASNWLGISFVGDLTFSMKTGSTSLSWENVFRPRKVRKTILGIIDSTKEPTKQTKTPHKLSYFWLLSPLLIFLGACFLYSSAWVQGYIPFRLPEFFFIHDIFVGWTVIIWGLILLFILIGSDGDPDSVPISIAVIWFFSFCWIPSYYLFGWIPIYILIGLIGILLVVILYWAFKENH